MFLTKLMKYLSLTNSNRYNRYNNSNSNNNNNNNNNYNYKYNNKHKLFSVINKIIMEMVH